MPRSSGSCGRRASSPLGIRSIDTATTGLWERGDPAATASQVFQSPGAAVNRNGVWTPASANISSFAGQTVRIRIEAADASTASLVEAAIDDVRITQQ